MVDYNNFLTLNESDISFDAIYEAYYGKTSGLKKAEKLCEKIIQYCHDVMNGKDIIINETREVKELEAIFEKEFNIGTCDLTFYLFSLIPGVGPIAPENAFALPGAFNFLHKSDDNKKLVDMRNLRCYVNVDISLVHRLDLTPDELMGVILHELGHCLNASIFTFLVYIPSLNEFQKIKHEADKMVEKGGSAGSVYFNSIIGEILGMLLQYPFKLIITKVNKFIANIINQNNEISSVLKEVLVFIQQLDSLFSPFITLFKTAKFGINPTALLYGFLDPRSLFGYQTERFSDSFATAYGYGVGISSFLNKLEKNENSIVKDVYKTVPIFGIGRDLALVSADIVFGLTNEHPKNAGRILNQLNKLKREINDPNLDPKVKKELKDNIDQLETIVNNEFLDKKVMETKDTGVTFVKFFYNLLIIKVFNGKMDPRELMNIGNFYEL